MSLERALLERFDDVTARAWTRAVADLDATMAENTPVCSGALEDQSTVEELEVGPDGYMAVAFNRLSYAGILDRPGRRRRIRAGDYGHRAFPIRDCVTGQIRGFAASIEVNTGEHAGWFTEETVGQWPKILEAAFRATR